MNTKEHQEVSRKTGQSYEAVRICWERFENDILIHQILTLRVEAQIEQRRNSLEAVSNPEEIYRKQGEIAALRASLAFLFGAPK